MLGQGRVPGGVALDELADLVVDGGVLCSWHPKLNKLRHGWGLAGLVVVMLAVLMSIVLWAPERVAVLFGRSFMTVGMLALSVSVIVKASRGDRK